MKKEPSRLSRALAVTLVAALASAGMPYRSFAQGDAAPAQAGSATSPDPELRRLTAKLSQAAALARDELARPGACPWDVHAKAVELGFDPARIFAFVQREVRFEPYAGVLRGAKGALAGRAANATDKALLLAALLDASGHRTRLVRGALPPEKARALVHGFLAADPLEGTLGRAGFAPATVGDLAAHAAALGLDARDLASEAARGARAADALLADADAAARRETDALLKSLVQAKVKLGRGFDAWMSLLAERAARHVWVEMRDAASEEERWVALDPTTPGAQAGAAPLPEAEVVEAGALERHAVALRVTLVRGVTDDGAAEREDAVLLLEVPLLSEDSIGEHARFSIAPIDAVPRPSEVIGMPREGIVKALAALRRFQPALRVGARTYSGRPFDVGGGIYDVTAGGKAEPVSEMGAAVARLTGGLGGLGEDEPPAPAAKSPPKVRLLRLEARFVHEVPFGEPRTQARTLLTAGDLTGPHILSPALDWQMLLEAQPQPPAVAAWHAARAGLLEAEAILPVLRAASLSNDDLDRAATISPDPFASVPQDLASLRGAALAARLGATKAPGGLALLWDTPNLVVFERRACMRPDAGHGCSRARIDIVENSLSLVPRTAPGAAAAAVETLAQGAFDTVAEALLLQRLGPLARTVASPVAGFARARIEGLSLTVGAAGDEAPPSAVIAAADWTRIREFEPAGRRIAAVARGAPGGGWWTLDPETGVLLGRASGGHGGVMAEYGEILATVVGTFFCVDAIYRDVKANVEKAAREHKAVENNAKIKWAVNLVGCGVGAGIGLKGATLGATEATAKFGYAVAGQAIANGISRLGSYLDTN